MPDYLVHITLVAHAGCEQSGTDIAIMTKEMLSKQFKRVLVVTASQMPEEDNMGMAFTSVGYPRPSRLEDV